MLPDIGLNVRRLNNKPLRAREPRENQISQFFKVVYIPHSKGALEGILQLSTDFLKSMGLENISVFSFVPL